MRRHWPVLLALLLLVASRPAAACTPPVGGLPNISAAERTAAADLVVLGDVIESGSSASIGVQQYLKGQGPARLSVSGYGSSAQCLSEIRSGERLIFFIKHNQDGSLQASYLSLFDAVAAPDPALIAEISAAAKQQPLPPENAANAGSGATGGAQQPNWDPAPPLALVWILAVAALIATLLFFFKRPAQ